MHTPINNTAQPNSSTSQLNNITQQHNSPQTQQYNPTSKTYPINPNTYSQMIFGSEGFEAFIGELQLSSLFSAAEEDDV